MRILIGTTHWIDRPTTTLIGGLANSARWRSWKPIQLEKDTHSTLGQIMISKELTRCNSIKGVPYGLRLKSHEFSASYLEQEAMYHNQNRYPCSQDLALVAHDDELGVLQTTGLVRFYSFDATSLRSLGPNDFGWSPKQQRDREVHNNKTTAPCKPNGMTFEDFIRYCQSGRLPCFRLYETDKPSNFELSEGTKGEYFTLKKMTTSLICGRLAKSSPYKRHWMRLSRAVILIKGEMHLLLDCSTTFPSSWADETNVKAGREVKGGT